MLHVEEILQMAVQKRGSLEAVEAVLPSALTEIELIEKTDDRYLSDMIRRIFQAGFSWKVVDKKWPSFEERFFHFNPKRCAFINSEEIEDRMRDTGLIRHQTKMNTIAVNAFMIDELATEHGSFGQWLADWPVDDIVGLWLYLKKHGSRLGGRSGPMFLRIAGKDTFLLTGDVVEALINFKVIDKNPTSIKALQEVQERFNRWQEESGRPMCEISRLLSLTV